MTTLDLINAALAAKDNFAQAQAALKQATSNLQAAQAALDQANRALHDDLAANGPCAVLDSATAPTIVSIYSALDPDTYSVTEIRIAG